MDMTTATHHFPDTGFVPDPRQLKRVAAGIAISLALHALLLSLYRQPQPALIPAAPEPLTVRLRPAVAPPLPLPVPAPEAQAIPRPQKPAPPVKRTRPARPLIAVPPETRQSAEETFAVDAVPATQPQEETPSSATPTLDIKAARSLARRLAREPDPTRAGTALERLPPPPLQTETRAARAIGAARRADCKDGIPGGVLAPLYLMMDKKDSGCKW
jgi:hypothetical protein